MSLTDKSLWDWVKEWNELVFFQPDDQLSQQTLNDTLDPSMTVKLNHSFFDINGFKGGVQWVRASTVTTLDSKQELLVWEAPDGVGGATVHKDVFSSTDKESGKKTTKDSFVITIVKAIDGKRKVSELVEVETER